MNKSFFTSENHHLSVNDAQFLHKLKDVYLIKFPVAKISLLVSPVSLIQYRNTPDGCPLLSCKLRLSVVLLQDQNDH